MFVEDEDAWEVVDDVRRDVQVVAEAVGYGATDVVEVQLGARHHEPAVRSAMYALLEGASRLGIKRDEIDGTLHRSQAGAGPSMVLYDTVPGGAGHARRIRDSLAAVIDPALAPMAMQVALMTLKTAARSLPFVAQNKLQLLLTVE